jgi:hypothetical protein
LGGKGGETCASVISEEVSIGCGKALQAMKAKMGK